MESSSLNTDFQTQLKQIRFKTYFHNRAFLLDYESLYADQRVVVFSVPNVMTTQTYCQFKSFDLEYTNLINAGIDEVYAVSSAELMVGPWADKHSGSIKGLADIDKQFVRALADFYGLSQSVQELAVTWQFVAIIDNGIPEKLWYVPFKANMPWMAIKNDMWRYRGLDVSKVLEYLKQPVDTTA